MGAQQKAWKPFTNQLLCVARGACRWLFNIPRRFPLGSARCIVYAQSHCPGRGKINTFPVLPFLSSAALPRWGWGSHHVFTQGPLYMCASNNVIHQVGSSRAAPRFPADPRHDFTAKRHIQAASVCGNASYAQERRPVPGRAGRFWVVDFLPHFWPRALRSQNKEPISL